MIDGDTGDLKVAIRKGQPQGPGDDSDLYDDPPQNNRGQADCTQSQEYGTYTEAQDQSDKSE